MSAAPFVFGTGDIPLAEILNDTNRMDFLEQLSVGQIVDLCFVAIDEHDHNLRRAIDACIAGAEQ
jgi:hypothetical protein